MTKIGKKELKTVDKQIFILYLEDEIEIDMNEAKQILGVNMLDISNYIKIGNQQGSNTGGFYSEKETGEQFYMKFYENIEITDTEFSANKFYDILGANVPSLSKVKNESGDIGIASKVVEGLSIDQQALKTDPKLRAGIMENFAIDCWLGMWDVKGLDWDNLLVDTIKGQVIRIDTGGSMRWRAMGTKKKASDFSCDVPELVSMKDPKRSAGKLFHSITDAEIQIGINKVTSLSDETIANVIGDDQELIDILICRRETLRNYFN